MMERLPPQDLDTERALLGSCMLGGPTVLDDVLPMIRSEMFYLTPHRDIWTALVATHERGEPMDLFAIENELKRMDKLDSADGREYLIELSESFADTANGPYYAGIVRDHFQRRRLISMGHKLANDSYTTADTPADVAGQFISRVESLITHDNPAECNAVDLLRRLPEHLAERSASFVKTGLEHFDANYIGLERGSMTVVAARPSVGKTALGLSFCTHAVTKDQIPAAFFSVEMPTMSVTLRIAANLAERSMSDLRKRCSPDDLKHYAEVSAHQLGGIDLFIHDEFSNVRDIIATAKQHIRRDGVGLIVVDYLQRCQPAERCENNNLAVASMSGAFKSLALQTNTAVVVLSQLRRGTEGRPPTLSDLRDSGAIEQDADVVILLNRETDTDDTSVDLTVDVAKSRNGPTGEFMVQFDRPRMRFQSFKRERADAK